MPEIQKIDIVHSENKESIEQYILALLKSKKTLKYIHISVHNKLEDWISIMRGIIEILKTSAPRRPYLKLQLPNLTLGEEMVRKFHN